MAAALLFAVAAYFALQNTAYALLANQNVNLAPTNNLFAREVPVISPAEATTPLLWKEESDTYWHLDPTHFTSGLSDESIDNIEKRAALADAGGPYDREISELKKRYFHLVKEQAKLHGKELKYKLMGDKQKKKENLDTLKVEHDRNEKEMKKIHAKIRELEKKKKGGKQRMVLMSFVFWWLQCLGLG